MAKHYIITDEAGRILRGFSDDFEQADASAICINEDGGRHFELNGVINPPMTDYNGVPLYCFDGKKIVARTQEELDADKPVIVHVPTIDERLAQVEELVKGTPSYGELLEAVNILLGE
ncbi:MAG: hypothetical protein EOM37_14660 [Proteobacteria bacterium]|nr:hypothetical protein [Pseudomonadota bacterium]